MNIRLEHPDDYMAILRLTYEAFLTLDYPGRRRMDEHYLIHLLKDSNCVISELCFVAELNGEIIGHILYTKSKFKRPDGMEANTITFGPLSVMPKFHRQGVGRALVQHSIEKAREMGFGAVLITGVQDYYPKLGFKRAREYNLTFKNGSSPDVFMVYELIEGYLHGGGTYHFWAPEFDAAENDDVEFAIFHQRFMSEYFPGELTLRPFYDNDIALMERWLYEDHVKPWYEHPSDWLKELRERREEFSFINHMIVEIDGKAIGFCQYYDCFYSLKYEVWDIEIHAPGEVFSIDYLIGEREYLRKGYSKAMISKMLDKLRMIGAKTVIVLPDSENTASNRALESSGLFWDGERYCLKLKELEAND